MSNWDLMMPGMGLTAIGLAGVVISYAGIAHTFIDGMHALTGLTMFIGLIFLAVGILDGGVSTSNKAKATTLVILSIGLGFGMFGFTMNTSDFTVTLAGILMAIAFPSIMIAYIAAKMPQYLKPVGSITAMAGATGIIMWVAFGFVSPDTYMIQEQSVEIEEPAEELEPRDIFAIAVLEGSATQGEPDYEPDVAHVPKGHVIEWTNEDSLAHTVTSADDFGETFDSGLFGAGEKFTLDTNDLDPGTYEYVCIVHLWMKSTIVIEEPVDSDVKVLMPEGGGIQKDGQIYYDPQIITIDQGTTVIWENADNTIHTVTSGDAEGVQGELFDSSIIEAGAFFEHTFDEVGSFDYICIVHPWMVGTVNVE